MTRHETLQRVPELTYKPAFVASQLTRLANLTYSQGVFFISPANWRPDIKPDVIYMQATQPESLLPSGQTLGCWTFEKASSDQRIVSVPNLEGLSLDAARKELEKLNLELLKTASRPVRAGQALNVVSGQYPRSRQSVYEGTGVFVQLGSKPTKPEGR